MEEILASIRRIIADEGGTVVAPKPADALPAAPRNAAPSPASSMNQSDVEATYADQGKQAPLEADVLELTETVEPAVPAGFRPVTGAEVMFSEVENKPAPQPAPMPAPAAAPAPVPRAAPAPRAIPAMRDELLAPATTAAVSSAFGSLATTILAENARTLEDLVRDMMRPMLKEWLDENLPGLVERMVRTEIERVSRGGR